MENPSQSHYTIEELFILKPEVIIEEVVKLPDVPVLAAADTTGITPSIIHEQPIKNAFWPKYKWYVIGGAIVIFAGVGWYIYKKDQKKRKNMQKIRPSRI